MKKKYPVILSDTERDELKRLIAAGTAPARKLTHARILLKADQSPEGPGWVDEQLAEALQTSQPTPPSPGCASNTSRRAFRQPSTDAHPTATTRESSTASRRHRWSRLPVANHQKGRLAGACGYWPTSWWSWRSWRRRSPTRRSEGF